jgi:hypothetical protein
MAIEPTSIISEITLELDEDEISLADFAKAFDNFSGLVKELSRQFAPSKDAGAWLVKVYSGSAGIGLSGRPGVFTGPEKIAIRTNLLSGLKELESGGRPRYFTDKAIECSKALSLLSRSKRAPARVRIWAGSEMPLQLTRAIAIQAESLLDVAYEDDGAIDGFLEKLSAHGQFEFVVYDALDNRPIRCEIGESKIEEAWSAFRKRVEVLGKVRYRKDGMPVSVKAIEIIPFPSAEDVPSPDEMRKLLAGE